MGGPRGLRRYALVCMGSDGVMERRSDKDTTRPEGTTRRNERRMSGNGLPARFVVDRRCSNDPVFSMRLMSAR